uniref:Probable ATP-dependent transporter ycf16 n=1 Tax=Rhodosorus marinus TaxID=101924 RepID=A0A7S3EQX5_9RHOD|mmetsp:Transcript_9600/g.41352  ORF Transcript_9600/g.41352 Transcript_9600/m.41352 type:complete len:729 (+) Transcript_9600:92-2278(+)|eukprot:CAMPEP_0113956540 /NCGR_PEP_ID=MMETSP0011_2-20120614/2134_1 /TAXON_ID=101924 /ORGANISM="Rhodosorus marinus" /LENGTH=728 /DNA_ID=CAMNT_0000966729 /DNA_START=52 /DNA_END=2238 /DNA_ORIENTATION=- /assembly_acc=CAM_ASM_000156
MGTDVGKSPAEVQTMLENELGKENVVSVDDEVLDYVINILMNTSTGKDEIIELLAPFFTEIDAARSLEESTALARSVRKELFGEEEENDAAYLNPKRLAAPTRMGSGYSVARRGKGQSNTTRDWKSSLDRSREAAKRKDAAMLRKAQRTGAALKRPLYESTPSVAALETKIQVGTKDVRVEGIDLSFGGISLLESATLQLSYGRKYGVVGRNGIGKSTLLKALARRELPVSDSLDLLYVEQEIAGDERSALQIVLASDTEREELLEEEKEILAVDEAGSSDLKPEAAARLEEIYKRLGAIDVEGAQARASSILAGLGFSTVNQSKPSNEFSGGWRMRIALACALFREPNLLLLDEPTNHLDLYAVLWLADYLNQWPHTLVVVSHDRDFLNSVCTDVIYIKDKQLQPYAGNYDDFEKARNERVKDMLRTAEAQEMKRKHVQKFVDRFRYNAKRAAMAQSRIKMLTRMEENKIVLPGEEEDFAFEFPEPEKLAGSHGALVLQGVEFGYKAADSSDKPTKILFENLDFSVNMDSRTVIVGPNGAGKSTLLKLLIEENIPLSGDFRKSPKMRIGYFSQHHIDQLVLWRTPLEHMKVVFPSSTAPELRGHLSKLGVSNEMALRPISTLSGGQKSRVALSVITYSKPHILILDEPTNHLDIETIDALVTSLNEFGGGVVLVTHDARLISTVCDEIYICEDGMVKGFPGDFREYREQLGKRLVKPNFKGKVDKNV